MLLGIWKNFYELEEELSMPELTAILVAKSESDYEERRFLAAMKGIDLDKETGKDKENITTFEDIKARVFSNGAAKDSRDILSLQGINAVQAGFGIGMGIDFASGDVLNPLA